MAPARQRIASRTGRGAWLALGGLVLVALTFTFALGVLVGRQSAHRSEPIQTSSEPARKAGPAAPRRGGLVEPTVEHSPAQEKLTFYQTLTAPLAPLPAPAKADGAAKSPPAKPAVTAERPPAPAPPPTERPSIATGQPPVARAPEPRAGDWTVQVGAFKDRNQAESVRKPLAAGGFDPYVIAAPGEDGQLRYKVRVGGYKTREDAARMAERVRRERSLTAFVTQR
jgi:cell division protein FtsN